MKYGILVLVVWLLLSANVSTASNPPPVEVHIQLGDVLHMYSCWPIGTWAGQPESLMVVYINYPSGVAGYICEYDGSAWLKPILPAQPVIVISY